MFLRICLFPFSPVASVVSKYFAESPFHPWLRVPPLPPRRWLCRKVVLTFPYLIFFTLSYIFLTFFTYFVFNKSRKSSIVIDSPASFLSDCTVKLFWSSPSWLITTGVKIVVNVSHINNLNWWRFFRCIGNRQISGVQFFPNSVQENKLSFPVTSNSTWIQTCAQSYKKRLYFFNLITDLCSTLQEKAVFPNRQNMAFYVDLD